MNIHGMEHSPFELTSKQKTEKEIQKNAKARLRRSYINDYVETNDLVKLKSDYLDMSQFFYNPHSKTILQVQTVGTVTPSFYTPEATVYQHIKQLNDM